jgi:hypothetical protein
MKENILTLFGSDAAMPEQFAETFRRSEHLWPEKPCCWQFWKTPSILSENITRYRIASGKSDFMKPKSGSCEAGTIGSFRPKMFATSWDRTLSI